MRISFTIYQVFRNGNWDLFLKTIGKEFRYDPNTWESDANKSIEIELTDAIALGLFEYIKQVIYNFISDPYPPDIIKDFLKRYGLPESDSDKREFINKRNDYRQFIYHFWAILHSSEGDTEEDIPKVLSLDKSSYYTTAAKFNIMLPSGAFIVPEECEKGTEKKAA